MKHFIKKLGAIIIIAIASSAYAQTIPDPEFSNRPYYVAGNNELKPLERADANRDIKAKGMGYGGYETYYTVFSKSSPVRFKKGAMPKIIIKVEGNVDPAETIVLSKLFEQKKDRRRFIEGKAKLGGKSEDISMYSVALEFKKIREGIFEVTFPATLEPGEYAFMPIATGANAPTIFSTGSQKQKITCFGVDE